ncbi:hypothetical protein L9F63_011349 [Diploptera punctata]|uniref:Major facilitator superfamily (MFS) profile domain-containing protein n=1 Tax=Diploptera punctata TaxID=6984 RepID=A0AAD8AEU4_DIPPU|nr:hypothetical protein L9F63_011349 [Diploptera punctata]
MVRLNIFSFFRRRGELSAGGTKQNEDERRQVRPQVALAIQHFLANIGLGMSMGHSAVLLPQVQHDDSGLDVDNDTASWIASVYMLVSPVGFFLGGMLLEKIGRRNGVLLGQLIYIVGWTLIATAQSAVMLICGRVFDGIGVGIIGSSGAILFDEMAHPRLRVTVLCLSSSFLSSGVLLMSSIGTYMNWRTAAALAVVPSVVQILIVVFLVMESPTYFVKKNKLNQAEKSLFWLWGNHQAKVKQELDDLVTRIHTQKAETIEDRDQHDICWKFSKIISNSKEYIQPYILKSFFIIHIFNLLQIPCGLGLLTTYTVDMLNAIQRNEPVISGYDATIIISALKVVFLLISAYILYRVGRRPIAIISGIGSSLPAIAISVLLYIQDGDNKIMSANDEAWVNFSLVLVYVIMNTLGFYCLTYTMIGEMLPAKVRGFLFGYILALNYLVGGGVTKAYPSMVDAFQMKGLFLMFGISNVICTLFVFIFLPETFGRTLEEIEDYFHEPNLTWFGRRKISSDSVRL